MLNKLNEKYLSIINKIKTEAKKQNVNAFIVGGVVRDLLMENEIKDIDFLIEGSAINFTKKSGFKIKSTHESFDTVKVEIEDIEIDIASTRLETYPKNGCLPVVNEVGIKIEDDLKRRDFTINSIALNILTNEIVDPFFGRKDIKQKTLKILHDKSFTDDPTRILRGLDFKYRFNFEFDYNTKKLIQECTNNYDNTDLSIDRIYLTLNKIFKNPYADKILEDILKDNIYKIWMKKTDLKVEKIPELSNAAKIFNIKEKSNLYITALESCLFIKAPLKDDYEIFEFFKKFTSVQLALYYFKTKDENACRYLLLKDIKPKITGKDLINLGFEQGKIIGDILSEIQKQKILNPDSLLNKEAELDFTKKHFSI